MERTAGKEQPMILTDGAAPPGGAVTSRKAVVLLSGGLDSSTVLAMVRAQGREAYAISFDYHQRHRIELEAAKRVAASLGVRKHLVVDFDLREIGGSALTADLAVPKSGTGNRGIPITYVPARNTIFLSFALAWAEVLHATDIFIGANIVDYSGYPDCRPEYLSAFEHMANLATRDGVEGRSRFSINSPLLSMTKSEIILKGVSLGLDYGLTWSCYDPQPGCDEMRTAQISSPAVYHPCGVCDSCRFRKKGFSEAGVSDPLDLTDTTQGI